MNKSDTKLVQLANQIKDSLDLVKEREGWSMDDLAYYLEINSMTLRNSMSKIYFSDMMVIILKLKKAIPESLAEEYRLELERYKINERKK